MGIEAKHAYRFGYLKSEEWQSVRIEALLRESAVCQICGHEEFSNDAHHVWYPKSIRDTAPEDLVILCRPCHELIHATMVIRRDRDEAFMDFRMFTNAIKTWFGKRAEVYKNPERVKRKLKYANDNPGKKIPRCAACNLPRNNRESFNVLSKYDLAQDDPHMVNSQWRVCAQCRSGMMDGVKWPKEPRAAFAAIRQWARAKTRNNV